MGGSFSIFGLLLVIIYNLYISCLALDPFEANAVLIVNTDAVLACTVSVHILLL
jgi:hypothetical protein